MDETHFTDFDAEEQELDAQRVQDMVNAGEMDFPCSDEVTLPDAVVETEESHRTDDINEVNDGGHHVDDFIEDNEPMWYGVMTRMTTQAMNAMLLRRRKQPVDLSVGIPACSALQDTSQLTLWEITGVQIVTTKLTWSLLESAQKCADSAIHRQPQANAVPMTTSHSTVKTLIQSGCSIC